MKINPTLASLLLLLLLTVPSSVAAATNDPLYQLPAPPSELMLSEEKYAPFAKMFEADLDRLLAAQPGLAREKLLLGMRVHLAIHFGENEVALRVAARIRELLADPADKAFAGLTTQAAVAARRTTAAGPGAPAFNAAFAREFDTQLAALPRTPEITAMLRGQRDKNAAISREALLEEVKAKIAPAIERHGSATLEDLDQLVRARHRLTDILPLRTEILQALDQAIAERSHL